MKKLIIIVSLIFLCSKGLAIPDSGLESFPIEGMKGLSRINQSEDDEFNRRMENLHWGRSVTRDAVYRGGAIGNLLPTDLQEAPSQDGVFPVKGMRGLSQQEQADIDRFNSAMAKAGWGRTSDTEPTYTGAIGNLLPTDFGESKYDTELSLQDLLSGEKTLNQLRAEKRAEDIEEYLKYFLCVGCVIIILIAVAQSKERID